MREKEGRHPMWGHSPSVGQKVSSRMVLETLAGCRMRGVDASSPLEVFGADRAAVLDPRGRCPWDALAEFEDGVMDLLGGPQAMEEMVFHAIEDRRAMRLVASLLLDPRSLYVMGTERIGRSMNSVHSARIDPLEGGGLRIELGFPGHLRGSAALLHGTTGLFRLMPTFLGLPPATVRAEIEPRRGVYSISLPSPQDVETCLHRSSEALRQGEGRLSEKEGEFSASLMDDSVVVEEGRRAGQTLLASSSAEELAAALFRWLQGKYFTRAMILEWTDESGSPRRLTLGEAVGGSSCGRTLTIGDTDIGRLVTDAPQRIGALESPLLRGALPFVAIALQNLRCRPGRPTDPWEDRLRRVAEDWSLPPRQREALGLLVRGLSNKEIACALGCSVKGIEAHVTRLLQRTKVTSRAELIARLAGLDRGAGLSLRP